MTTIIPVQFKYSIHDLWFDPKDTGAQQADHVIVSTERGTEIGLAVGDPCEVDDETLEATIGDAPLQRVLRIATEADLAHAERLSALGDQAMPAFRRLVQESGLDMKPVGVEYLFGGEKVVCYFAAVERVDFRQLVRSLSHELHARIDMRQIGVREEAAIIGGYGHCGQELCCRRFGHEFQPVSIRMAKEQDLPLNSNKVSGTCGRLMCCLRYEFEAYREFKSRAPKRNAVIDTPFGKAKIVEYDTPKESLLLRAENGKTFRVALEDMTASEAVCKKAAELGCACRPDTVSRAALERLESPEIQMALAELDRERGILPPEPGLAESDNLFPETKRKRRRAQRRDQDAAKMTKVEIPSDEPAPATPKPRRRKGRARDAEAEARAQETAAEQPRSRRRHHRAEGAAPAEAAHPQKEGRAPRRRHASGDAPAQPAGQTRTRRRPGDKGGRTDAQASEAPRARRDQAGPAPKGDEPKASRPRRRRRRKPDGGAEGGGPQAS